MTTPITHRHDGIALCLSGGGFRAALFHLGALRRLHELGVLQRLEAVSSVSGGSIIAGYVATRLRETGRELHDGFGNWQSDVSDPFRAFCSRDFRTVPLLLHLPWNWLWPGPLLRHLERRYGKRLTALRLRDLPEQPRFTLCATNLTDGVNWEFTREGAGDYRNGHRAGRADWPLARAITASACFPPLLGPMRIGRVRLSDGGVYDNMGTEPVWKEWSHILISDGGAPFERRNGGNPLSRLLRYTEVITSQTRALRLRSFFGDIQGGRYDGAYWTVGSGAQASGARPGEPPYVGYSQALATEVLARVRTDLDRFTPAELSVLENHGYWAAERSLRKHLAAILPDPVPEPVTPYPEWADEPLVRRELRDSHRRFSLRRLMRSR